MLTSLVPRPSPFFVLRFAFSIIQKRATKKKRGRPGLIHHVSDVRWMRGGRKYDVMEEGSNHKNNALDHTFERSTAVLDLRH